MDTEKGFWGGSGMPSPYLAGRELLHPGQGEWGPEPERLGVRGVKAGGESNLTWEKTR